MDVDRYTAEAAARPDRKFSTLRDDWPAPRGGGPGTSLTRQPRPDGTLYWQLDNPACVFSANMLFKPEA
jgi:hypothetical protein